MKIIKGSDRIVFVFQKIAVKLPRIHFFSFLSLFLYHVKHGNLLKYLNYQPKVYGSARRLLFRGLIHNWNEFYFYLKSHSDILLPTYFSLFGFVNIQKKGEKFEMKEGDLWIQILKLKNKECWIDGHTFSNVDNFCKENYKIKMIDYGDPDVYCLLKKYGNAIHDDFDFSYKHNNRSI